MATASGFYIETKKDCANEDQNWKRAVVICNYQYEAASGFSELQSARADFQRLVVTLGNDHNYNLTIMGPIPENGFHAGQDFQNTAEQRGFINTEDIYDSLEEYINTMEEEMKNKNKRKIGSFFYHYIGHGVHSHGQDCMVGTTGRTTRTL